MDPLWKELRTKLKDLGADLEGQLAYLQDLRQRCKEGIPNQKNSAKGTVVDLVEKLPALELQATKEMIELAKYIIERSELSESHESQGVTFSLNFKPLE